MKDFIGRIKRAYPNPCIVCNRMVKEKSLLDKAKEIGGKYIATGHYARIEKHPKTGRYAIRNSATAEKDQTYALYRLTQEQLGAMLLPIGEYTKDEVRKIAEAVDGFVAKKGESQDICFIPDGDYAAFIEREGKLTGMPGNFVDMDGTILGKHKGLIHYTIGQRKGLGIALGKPPLCIVWIRKKTRLFFPIMRHYSGQRFVPTIWHTWRMINLRTDSVFWRKSAMRISLHGVLCGWSGRIN